MKEVQSSKKWASFSDIEIMNIEVFNADLSDKAYSEEFKKRMMDRVNFIKSRETQKAGLDKLPADALESLESVVNQIW